MVPIAKSIKYVPVVQFVHARRPTLSRVSSEDEIAIIMEDRRSAKASEDHDGLEMRLVC